MLINIKPVSKKYSNEFSLELDQSECSVSMAHSQSMKYDLKLKKSPDHDGNVFLRSGIKASIVRPYRFHFIFISDTVQAVSC